MKKRAKKTEQVGFRVESDVFQRLQKMADEQRRPIGQLARILFENSLEQAERRQAGAAA